VGSLIKYQTCERRRKGGGKGMGEDDARGGGV